MKDLKRQSEGTVEIDVYLSKAADTMLKFYRLDEELKNSFAKVTVESNSNSPFLAGMMQSHKYEFLLIFQRPQHCC
jgi:flavoprotein